MQKKARQAFIPDLSAGPLVRPEGLSGAEAVEWDILVSELKAAGRPLSAADVAELRTIAGGRARLRDPELSSSTYAALVMSLGRQVAALKTPTTSPAAVALTPQNDRRMRPLPFPVPADHPAKLPWSFDKSHKRYHQPCDGGACCGRAEPFLRS